MLVEENIFNVINARISIEDFSRYIIVGWFETEYSENLEDYTILALLDSLKLDVGFEKKDDFSVKAKYMAMDKNIYEEDYMDIKLPADLKKYKKLSLFLVNKKSNDKNLFYEVNVSTLIKQQTEINYFIEDFTNEENDVLVKGWVACPEKVDFSVVDSKNNLIEHEVEWFAKPDVIDYFYESSKERLGNCGFNLRVKNYKNKKFFIRFESGNKKSIYSSAFDMDTKHGNKYVNKAKKLVKYSIKTLRSIKDFGIKATWKKVVLKLHDNTDDYMKWRENIMPKDADLIKQKNTVFSKMPLISIVVPLYKTPEKYLNALVNSVIGQSYTNWELVLSDGSGENSPMRGLLDKTQALDNRIKVIRNEKQLHISENTNVALKAAKGDLIAFADHDDVLSLDALFECVKIYNKYDDVGLIYSDEDKISDNGLLYFQPHFKPDFSIDFLRSINYFCHLVVVTRELREKVGFLNPEYNGAQDYDFVLRCVENTKGVYHIPKILYHWRAGENSTANDGASKMYAFESGKRAVQAHLERLGFQATVEMGASLGSYKTTYHWEEEPLISILIPNKDHIDQLKTCIESIENRSVYRNFEFIIIENNSTQEETFEYYKEIEAKYDKVHVVYYKGDFNYSKINNFGESKANGEYLLLLNNDTEIINPDTLGEMLGYCMREDVGIVGAKLLYPNDTVQHAGVVIGFGGIAGHTFIGFDKNSFGYFTRLTSAQNYSAVTAACLMTKRSVFKEVGGLTEELRVAMNDVDYCLKVREKGYLVVYNPAALLYHYESLSRGLEDTPEKIERFHSECEFFANRWSDILKNGDPYYNRNLSLMRSDFALRRM
ncbi:Glycosyltransferase, GT2 family [Acetitomaculum ruminis DSM 5522]|uniref:Glycosyltransferase, GT2 family n=1 Tax=Acetitomaculum ruminis DSM 5522 TaxID=1120918 RepID=A0A1I0VMD2_9FIRM|nr:glycosyltransferase family 2 protein [Acetitomaculum ruminis]SFA77649.1 Glycosyltransferase, GT2 family [Acetitomaculum ruminis DSM 5522]